MTKTPVEKKQREGIYLEEIRTIENMDKQEWNRHMGNNTILDWEGIQYLERTFSNHPDPTNKWDFYYYIVRDQNGNVVLMTFFTFGLWKDDMLSTESVSKQLEEDRKSDPLHMISKVLSMGSLFTEGLHYYLDESHPLANQAIQLLLNTIEETYESLAADMLVLRDLEPGFRWDSMIRDQGYFRIDMPESCVLQNLKWPEIENYGSLLSARSRRHFNQEILPYEKFYDIEIKESLDASELERAYRLYCNVKDRNLAINTFQYSKEIFENMNECPNWEFLILTLKDTNERHFVGIMFCYKNSVHTYVPELIGMDYVNSEGFQLYRQLLFQTIKRAAELQIPRIDFGISATFEKKKLGATALPKIAYIQARDNYAMEVLQTLQNENSAGH